MTSPASASPLGNRLPSAEDRQIANQLRQILAAHKAGEAHLQVFDPATKKPVDITLTPAMSDLFIQLLRYIGSGDAVTLLPIQQMLTTQQAADLLNVSRPYAPGTVLEVVRRQRGQGLQKGSYAVVATDLSRERVTLQNERGRQFEFRPGQLRPQGEQDALKLYERREIEIHDGDCIRWTATDHRRGLLNADQARIIAVDAKGVSLATSVGVLHRLAPTDPMLKRLDLAYALNAHMAQGLTSDSGIAVMDSREKNLANQQTFLVTITRLRDRLTLFVDNAGKLEAAVENNPGMKRSALETVDLLRNAAATGAEKGRASEAERKAPELDRSISRKFDMGL